MRIEPDPLIADQISYNIDTNTMSYSGQKIYSGTSSSEMTKIKITLVNALGEIPYMQVVMVFIPVTEDPPFEDPSIESPAETKSDSGSD